MGSVHGMPSSDSSIPSSPVDVIAELAANVWKVEVTVGQVIEEGHVVAILESMKMEIPVEAPCSGTVTAVNVAPDSQVQDGDVIAVIQP
jgi:biotin carboxyl carrier protein